MAAISTQFSSGDQSGSGRKKFWASGFKTCQKCLKKTIKETDHVAGCRMNGDGYGTTVFNCTSCGWKTSFQYDDAATPYYYETRSWKAGIKGMDISNLKNWLKYVKLPEIAKLFDQELIDGERISLVNENSLLQWAKKGDIKLTKDMVKRYQIEYQKLVKSRGIWK
eukprot:48548_1